MPDESGVREPKVVMNNQNFQSFQDHHTPTKGDISMKSLSIFINKVYEFGPITGIKARKASVHTGENGPLFDLTKTMNTFLMKFI